MTLKVLIIYYTVSISGYEILIGVVQLKERARGNLFFFGDVIVSVERIIS